MSETTADILMKLGGYELKSRGQREVKVRLCQTGPFLAPGTEMIWDTPCGGQA